MFVFSHFSTFPVSYAIRSDPIRIVHNEVEVETVAAVVGIKFHTALAQSRDSKIAFRANSTNSISTQRNIYTLTRTVCGVQAKRVVLCSTTEKCGWNWKKKTVKNFCCTLSIALWWKKNGRRTWARARSLPLYVSLAVLKHSTIRTHIYAGKRCEHKISPLEWIFFTQFYFLSF